jgi:hypothetical protein
VGEQNRFEVGDLVRYYVFTTYYYGEGSVSHQGIGMVIKKEYTEWSPYAQRWLEAATYGSGETGGLWRYDVLCSKTGNTYRVSSKGLILIKSAKKEEEE